MKDIYGKAIFKPCITKAEEHIQIKCLVVLSIKTHTYYTIVARHLSVFNKKMM